MSAAKEEEEEEFVRALGRANTSLKPDKSLLNSKFEQYKYTSGRLDRLSAFYGYIIMFDKEIYCVLY